MGTVITCLAAVEGLLQVSLIIMLSTCYHKGVSQLVIAPCCFVVDPNLLDTLEAYDGTVDFLRSLELDNDALTKAIIGTMGDLDAYQLPDAKGYSALSRWAALDWVQYAAVTHTVCCSVMQQVQLAWQHCHKTVLACGCGTNVSLVEHVLASSICAGCQRPRA